MSDRKILIGVALYMVIVLLFLALQIPYGGPDLEVVGRYMESVNGEIKYYLQMKICDGQYCQTADVPVSFWEYQNR